MSEISEGSLIIFSLMCSLDHHKQGRMAESWKVAIAAMSVLVSGYAAIAAILNLSVEYRLYQERRAKIAGKQPASAPAPEASEPQGGS